MRVIAGRLGGQSFASPKSFKTHPMSEKIRGAIFNMLGDISGLSVLDAFAGSGALAIEALSRGAVKVTSLDSDKAAASVMQANARSLQLARQWHITQAPVLSWIEGNQNLQFDIIFADPPYNEPHLSSVIALGAVVAPEGLLVVSLPPTVQPPTIPALTIIRAKQYGDATVTVYTSAKQA